MEKTFELKSLKLEAIGVSCKYRITETDDEGVTTENDYKVKVSRPVHPDLERLFHEDLKDAVASILGRPQMQREGFMEPWDVEPDTVALSGNDEGAAMAVSGTVLTAFGKVIVKLPRVKYKAFDGDAAARMTVIADALTNEAYAYLFENKGAEMEVFGE